MLICAIDKSLIHFRKGDDNLVLLKIWNSLVEDDPSVQLRDPLALVSTV